MKIINAKGNGLEPESMAKAAVAKGETELEMLLDNPVSAAGVVRFLESRGFGVQLKDDEGTITISARKGTAPYKAAQKTSGAKKQPDDSIYETQPIARPQIIPPKQAFARETSAETFSVLIVSRTLGADTELGAELMKNFLSSLTRMELPPAAVALMNEGVKLALYDSSSCDHLKSLEKKGVSILVCGTCANYFNVMDQIGAGSASGMPEIIETLNRAGKIITL